MDFPYKSYICYIYYYYDFQTQVIYLNGTNLVI